MSLIGIANPIPSTPEPESFKVFIPITLHASYMRSQPLHHSQQEVETAEGYSVFEYYMRPTCDLIQEILSRGSDVEVVSPERFRKKVAEVIRRMAGRYDGDS